MDPEMLNEGLDLLKTLVAPAIGTSLAVMLAVRWLTGPRGGSAAALLAFAAAVYVGGVCVPNKISTLEPPPWQLEKDRPLSVSDLRKVLYWTLEGKPPPPPEEGDAATPAPAEETPNVDPALPNNATRYWIPWLACLAMVVEFVLPIFPRELGWVVRTFLSLLAGRLLTDYKMRVEIPWMPWTLGLVILLEWGLLTFLARQWRDGIAATSLGVACAFGAVVVMLAHQSSAGEYALLAGASLAGPALISWKWPSDTRAAVAPVAVILPALMLEGLYNQGYEGPVPVWSFVLAAVAPLALLPFWIPFLARRERWTRWVPGLILPIIPALLAVVWAVPQAPE